MTPTKYDIELHADTDFLETVKWLNPDLTAVDLTGYTFLCQVRTSANSANVLLQATLTVPNPVDGTIYVAFSGVDITNADSGDWEWDLLAFALDGTTYKLVYGKATVILTVSRAP
jgi:hypothetical protein